MKRNVISILLTAALLVPFALTGCGGKTEAPASTTQAEGQATTAEPVATTLFDDALPDTDMKGFTLKFINYTDEAHGWSLKDVNKEEETGEAMNDAIYNRNRKIEERFNAVITEMYDKNPLNIHKNEVLAGSPSFDVTECYDSQINSMVNSQTLLMWGNIPYLNFEKEWWNEDANSMFRVGNKVYAAVGDFNLSEYSKSYLYFFNKKLYDDLGFKDDLYGIVKEGKWTEDKLLSYCKVSAQDLDGDGVMGEDDQYGLVETTKVHYQMLITGAGYKFVDVDKDGTPYFAVPGNEPLISAMQKFIADHSVKTWYYQQENPNGGIADNIFEKGKSLFVSSTMWNTEKYREYEFDVGMLPAPKLTEEQPRYYTITIGGVVSILPKAMDSERFDNIGILLEALAADSHYFTLPVYKEVTLQSKYARDKGSAEMVDLLFETQVYDLGVTLWSGIRSSFMTNVFHTLNNNISSYLESNRTSFENTIKTTIDLISQEE